MIHIWRYKNSLNIVMIEVTGIAIPCQILFGLLNAVAVFVRGSYVRFGVWVSLFPDNGKRPQFD